MHDKQGPCVHGLYDLSVEYDDLVTGDCLSKQYDNIRTLYILDCMAVTITALNRPKCKVLQRWGNHAKVSIVASKLLTTYTL